MCVSVFVCVCECVCVCVCAVFLLLLTCSSAEGEKSINHYIWPLVLSFSRIQPCLVLPMVHSAKALGGQLVAPLDALARLGASLPVDGAYHQALMSTLLWKQNNTPRI